MRSPLHRYRGYGLEIASELSLPEFLPAGTEVPADIVIRLAEAADGRFRPAGNGPVEYEFVPAESGGHLLLVPDVGLFHVADGREISVLTIEAPDAGILRLFLIGSAMGMALHQRGVLVMHGATVLGPGGRALMVVGEQGAGKSTLAAALGRAGMAILGDDTMPVWRRDGRFVVWPGSRLFKLWRRSLDHFGEDPGALEQIRNRTEKFFWPNRAEAPDRAATIGEIVELATAPAGQAPRFEALDGLSALRLIADHTYRPHYVHLLDRQDAHFRQCAELAGAVRVGRLTRPDDLGQLDASVALLRDRWAVAAAAP